MGSVQQLRQALVLSPYEVNVSHRDVEHPLVCQRTELMWKSLGSVQVTVCRKVLKQKEGKQGMRKYCPMSYEEKKP